MSDEVLRVETEISQIKEILKEIDEVIRSKVRDDVVSFDIKSELHEQSVTGHSLKDLTKLKDHYRMELRSLERELGRLQGKPSPRQIVPRFND